MIDHGYQVYYEQAETGNVSSLIFPSSKYIIRQFFFFILKPAKVYELFVVSMCSANRWHTQDFFKEGLLQFVAGRAAVPALKKSLSVCVWGGGGGGGGGLPTPLFPPSKKISQVSMYGVQIYILVHHQPL